MSRKRKRARTVAASRPQQQAPTRSMLAAAAGRGVQQWKWRTFPVFFAFVAGLLIASVINPPNGDAGYALQLAALAGFGYALAHLFVTNVLAAGRLRRRRQAVERGEAPPEAFEEELVYPDQDDGSTRSDC